MGVSNGHGIEVAVEGVLLWSASMVGDLQLGLVVGGIVEEIDIAAATETVVRWLGGGIVEVVMDVGEAENEESTNRERGERRGSYSVVNSDSPGPAGILEEEEEDGVVAVLVVVTVGIQVLGTRRTRLLRIQQLGDQQVDTADVDGSLNVVVAEYSSGPDGGQQCDGFKAELGQQRSQHRHLVILPTQPVCPVSSRALRRPPLISSHLSSSLPSFSLYAPHHWSSAYHSQSRSDGLSRTLPFPAHLCSADLQVQVSLSVTCNSTRHSPPPTHASKIVYSTA